jgi:radical SAM superfamily enzyme YgiQ (UPF0313 family)
VRILLIEPRKASVTIGGEDVYLYEPLALEYLAAGVVRDHDVRILDMRLENDWQEVLANFRPDVVGITSYTVHVNTVRSLFDRIKHWNPQVLTVVGGHHATVAPEDFHSPSVDLIVLGEGVFTFQEIVNRLEAGKGFDRIPGTAFARGGKLVKTDYAAKIDLDAFPFPNRELTAKYRAKYHSEWMRPLASVRTSKGCPYRCNFCALWKLTGGQYLKRKPERVVEELVSLDEEFIFFADDESLIDSARMKALARLIKDAGIRKRYFLYGRSDTIVRDPEVLEMWKEIGLERAFVGLEFFRDEDLAYVKKGSSIGDNEKAVEILQDLDIEIFASFIVRPEFNRADFAAFGQYCRSLRLSFAGFAVLTPLPGTDFYQEVRSQLITNNYDYFDFFHPLLPTALPLKEFHEAYYQLFRRAVPFTKSLKLLRRYPLEEIPATLGKHNRFLNRLRSAYLDYPNDKML